MERETMERETNFEEIHKNTKQLYYLLIKIAICWIYTILCYTSMNGFAIYMTIIVGFTFLYIMADTEYENAAKSNQMPKKLYMHLYIVSAGINGALATIGWLYVCGAYKDANIIRTILKGICVGCSMFETLSNIKAIKLTLKDRFALFGNAAATAAATASPV